MRKTKKAKQSPRVAKAVSKRLKPIAAAPSAVNDLFPVNSHKTDTTADTASLDSDPQQDIDFPGSKAA